jgi:hypothetical protein
MLNLFTLLNTRWLNANQIFPLVLSAQALADENYYAFVMMAFGEFARPPTFCRVYLMSPYFHWGKIGKSTSLITDQAVCVGNFLSKFR